VSELPRIEPFDIAGCDALPALLPAAPLAPEVPLVSADP
jgi:hypothetical protein